MRNLWLFLVALTLIAFAVSGIILLTRAKHPALPGTYSKESYSSTGERIYYETVRSDGSPIPFKGGPPWLGKMTGRGCVTCHGIDGKGGLALMMTSTTASDISYESLVSGKHHGDEQGGSEEVAYTDKTIKAAITQGIDPNEKKLSPIMPRWQMTDEELNELLTFLKQL